MHEETEQSSGQNDLLRSTREALAQAGYALVGAGAYVLDAVRSEQPPDKLRDVGQRTAEWTRAGGELAADGFRRLREHGRTVWPELEELRGQAREVAEDVTAAAREAATGVRQPRPERAEPATATPAGPGAPTTAGTGAAPESSPGAGAPETQDAAGAEVEDADEAEGETEPAPDYADMTVEQLRQHARDAEIEGRSRMNKAELIAALEDEAG